MVCSKPITHRSTLAVIDKSGRAEYATFASTGTSGTKSGRRFRVVAYAELGSVAIAGTESGRRFRVVAYAELGSVAIAEEAAGDRSLISS